MLCTYVRANTHTLTHSSEPLFIKERGSSKASADLAAILLSNHSVESQQRLPARSPLRPLLFSSDHFFYLTLFWHRPSLSLPSTPPTFAFDQFQVRVVGVAVDHVCNRSASAGRSRGKGEGGRRRRGEAASQGHFQISLVGLSCGREASRLAQQIVFPGHVSLQRTSLSPAARRSPPPPPCPSPAALLRPTRSSWTRS